MILRCLSNFTSLFADLAEVMTKLLARVLSRVVSKVLARVPATGTQAPLVLFLLFAVTLGSQMASSPAKAAEQTAELRLQRCFDEISQANQSFTDGRADIANERLLQLTHSCSNVAHLYHNLGAIAALRRNWDQAVTYLEQSLAIDRRAALTQAGLSGIFQYKAALAYRKALDLSGPLPKPPAISLQSGEIGNGPVATPLTKPLVRGEHSGDAATAAIEPVGGISADESGQHPNQNPNQNSGQILESSAESSAVLIEVASWWSAKREKSPQLPPLSTVSYSIDSLAQDLSLVLLAFKEQQLLLVVRKTDNHWQVIREKSL